MKALEFQTVLTPQGVLDVPPAVAAQLSPGQSVRVLLLVAEPNDDQAWSSLTAEQFLQGYADSDAIYDQLSAG